MSFNGSAGGHLCSVYFAPRGRDRIYQLGMQIAQQHLSPADRIIGVIGEAGSGKSMIIKGMFPGLELTNDDEGVNVRPLPLLCQDDENRFYSPHTYHMDARFELGFTQLHVLVDAIREAVARGKRVIIEHFDLVYEALGFNADLIVGIGEEVIVTRPNIFGPLPEDVAKVVHKSVHTRLMAHTAEDLCEFHMPEKEVMRCLHADIKSGFLMAFHDSPPEVDLEELEKAVLADIAADLPVEYVDDRTIRIGDAYQPCTGPRTHVSSTGKIVGFHLLKEIIYDHRNQRWLLVGRVGNVNVDEARHHFNDLGLV
ncbi:MAG: alanine-tRNA synthetase second additional domain-containing protein [Clostridiaceae bacterium]|nr:alanine-tRNA synthetase second additional domain-containing protein [Clostridia bacterium]MDY3870471.1 alanine-tRNA synthetase second additional domain-containing protein [Clostridiaceae bacterium]